ncbi:cilia- and flagella-associated protein 61-like [Ctenocephalides felis]|uniref:cilia- and flagella-associated protein 61-like n=1 Tax=Ctenocephalides felis TaxID=7515 RepID=UPI000E6E21A9|nr:cilia- and flagella-associated protein 61-like [Ctenocephalides felis]
MMRCTFDNFGLCIRNSPLPVRKSELIIKEACRVKSAAAPMHLDLGVLELPPVSKWRQSEHQDAPRIKALEVPGTFAMFGAEDVHIHIEKAYSCISLFNEEQEIIASLALYDFPNIPALSKCWWEDWMKSKYQLHEVTVWNTLFINYLVWDSRYNNDFMKFLIESIFLHNLTTNHIIIVSPPGNCSSFFPGDTLLDEYFTRLLPEGYTDFDKVQTIYICLRESHVPRLKIRRGMEEDNDDIVPILDAQCPLLRETYGDYYIAELVAAADQISRRLIVAEKNDRAVGVICLNPELDYDILNESFELVPFNGLRKLPRSSDENDTNDYVSGDEEVHGSNITKTPSEDNSATLMTTSMDSAPLSRKSSNTQSNKSITSGKNESKPIRNRYRKHCLGEEMVCDEFVAEFGEEQTTSGPSFDSLSFMTPEDYHGYSINMLSHVPRTPTSVAPSLRKFFSGMDVDSDAELYTRRPSSTRLPRFAGKPNAFVIELFALRDDMDPRLGFDFLLAAFEVFPELEFGILTVPSEYPPFPFLDHFTKATPRTVKTFDHELYITHKNTILCPLIVREAEMGDMNGLISLLSSVRRREDILDEFEAAVSFSEKGCDDLEEVQPFQCPLRAFVAHSNGTLVGVAIITPENDAEYLKAHYNLDHHISYAYHKDQAILRHMVLGAIFQPHSKFFLKEIIRLSDVSLLYYCLYPPEVEEPECSLITCISNMIPIKPRKKIHYDKVALGKLMPSDAITRIEKPFALYYAGNKTVASTKLLINTQIVIVGAGDTAMAFLEGLFFSPSSQRIQFDNVTVVSPHGFPHSKNEYAARDHMFPFTGRYDLNYSRSISLRTYTNVIMAAMNAIDRYNKRIILDDGTAVNYDMLFLFCGAQYPRTPALKNAPMELQPRNVFYINTETDAAIALRTLEEMFEDDDIQCQNVIVYGDSLEAYCCLNALLEFGINPENLYFVECFPKRDSECMVSIFNDNEVDELVQKSIEYTGIQFFPNHYYMSWVLDRETNMIISAKFESRFKMADIPCAAMFYYGTRLVSTKTFTAINRAGLVYDGRLVIDNDCKTNDPNIWAAGRMTKYARKYYADSHNHEHYNSMEIGGKLAQRVVRMLDPSIPFNNTETKIPGMELTVTIYEEPLVVYCILPGPLNYLSVTKPGKVVPLDAKMSQDTYGQSLVTGDQSDYTDQGYFRLHLDQYNIVADMTCLTKYKIDVDNLVSIWGKHERLLNNLLLRFDRAMILNLYEFFREPWAYALYHDQFKNLHAANMEILQKLTVEHGKSILEDTVNFIETHKYEKVSEQEQYQILKQYIGSEYQRKVEQGMLDFIFTNRSELPMYAHPDTLRTILGNFESCPEQEVEHPPTSTK